MPNVFLSEDYLMRMLNQAMAALAMVLGFKTSGRYQDAEQLIHQTLESIFGLRSGLLLQLDDERIKEMLTYQDTLNLQLLVAVADLFKEEAEILRMSGSKTGMNDSPIVPGSKNPVTNAGLHPAEADALSVRALNFYLEALLEGYNAAEAGLPGKVDELLHSLGGVSLPVGTVFSLYDFYKNSGQYRQAEAALQRLLSPPAQIPLADPNPAISPMEAARQARLELHELYSSLLAMPSAALEQTGYTKEEIQGKLRQLSPRQRHA